MGITVQIGPVRRTKAETLARWRDIRQEWQRQLERYSQDPEPEPVRCEHGILLGPQCLSGPVYCTVCAGIPAPGDRRGHTYEIQAGLCIQIVRMKLEHPLRLNLRHFRPRRGLARRDLTPRGFQDGIFYEGDHQISAFDNHLRMYEEQTGWYVRSGKSVGIAIRSQRPTPTAGFLWDGDARFTVERSLSQGQMPNPVLDHGTWVYTDREEEDLELYRGRGYSKVIAPCLSHYTGLIEIAKPASYAQWRDLSERQPSKRGRRKAKRDTSGWDTSGAVKRGSSAAWPYLPGPETCTDKQIEKWRARDWKKHKPFDEKHPSWTVQTQRYSVTRIHCRLAPSISERGLKDLNAVLKIENYGWQPEAELPLQTIPPRYNPTRMVKAIRKRWERKVWANGGVSRAQSIPRGSTETSPRKYEAATGPASQGSAISRP